MDSDMAAASFCRSWATAAAGLRDGLSLPYPRREHLVVGAGVGQGVRVSQRNPGEFLVSDPADAGQSLYFMKVPEPKVGKNRLHLDLVTAGSMEAEVTRLAEAGAELVEVRQDPLPSRIQIHGR
jgi:Glyoxalase-like domain